MTSIDKPEILSHSFSHVGKVRQENEDYFRLCNPDDEFTESNGHLYGIADGMGGYALGSKASSLAIETFFDTFYDSDGATTVQKFKAGIQNANLIVYQTAQKLGVGRMGTTLTAVNFIGNNLFVGHVGDSRAYLIRDKKASLITNDHTRVGELVRMKILTKDKIRTHSQRSVLDKCLGFNLFVQPDIFKLPVKNDDIIILCTDGVWAVIEDDEFAELANSTPDPESLSREIGELALSRDHDDNLTAVVIRLNQIVENDSKEEPKGSWLLPRLFNRFVR